MMSEGLNVYWQVTSNGPAMNKARSVSHGKARHFLLVFPLVTRHCFTTAATLAASTVSGLLRTISNCQPVSKSTTVPPPW